jgi:hypothetical protein
VAKRIGGNGYERRLGADHRKVDPEGAGQLDEPVHVLGPHGVAAPELGDTGIPGRGVQLSEHRARDERSSERVLAAA